MVKLLYSDVPRIYEKDQRWENSMIPYADHYTMKNGELIRLDGIDPGHNGYYTTIVTQGIVMNTPPEIERQPTPNHWRDAHASHVHEGNWMQFKWEVIDQLLPIYDRADDWTSEVGLDKEVVDQTEWDPWCKPADGWDSLDVY